MEMEKLIIAGAGPAGVSAALYAVRSGITPLVLHKGGGALEKAVKIENYYGLPEPVTGAELYKTGLKQLESFQVPVVEEELLAVEYDGGLYCPDNGTYLPQQGSDPSYGSQTEHSRAERTEKI